MTSGYGIPYPDDPFPVEPEVRRMDKRTDPWGDFLRRLLLSASLAGTAFAAARRRRSRNSRQTRWPMPSIPVIPWRSGAAGPGLSSESVSAMLSRAGQVTHPGGAAFRLDANCLEP